MPRSKSKPKAVTIKTIAEKSGFDPSTVSRVLNGRAKEFRISQATVDIILEVNKKYNYQPNPVAVNLRIKKSFTIGLVIPTLNNPFFVNFTSILNRELTKRGYNMILTESNDEPQMEEKVIKQLLHRNIDGIILIPCREDFNLTFLDEIYNDGIPIIYIDRYMKDSIIPYIVTDNEKGAYEGVKYLIEKGHRKIACIQGLVGSSPCIDRKNGYLKALKEHKLKPFYLEGDEFSIECGIRETEKMLKTIGLPTAIFAMSSTIALGVINVLKKQGYSIPEDISLIGFDDNIFLDYLATPLTCISQPVEEISEAAIKALINHLDGKNDLFEFKSLMLDSHIVHRKSVK
jgi:LacI family transcriptional regulator